jgi:hypothetical protein
MEDYRTRRLGAGSEEPKPEDDEQEEEAQTWGAPPPLPVEEEEPLPPPPLPQDEDAGEVNVFYQSPPEPRRAEGETVVAPSSWYDEKPAQTPVVPSPFEEPVIEQAPVTFGSGPQPRPVTPELVVPSVGGGGQAAPPPGPGAPAKKNNTPLIIGIVVAVLLLLCCCCVIAAVALSSQGDGWEWEFNWIGATLLNLLR